ncbi:hypothetical protein ACH5RR_018266 [Cinchona calisaya]|uniref:Uncharacterized protein n=1 Tax=Cinchona calisaya TaxID=153742 RepID=A0ABD2ZNT8_9GENT
MFLEQLHHSISKLIRFRVYSAQNLKGIHFLVTRRTRGICHLLHGTELSNTASVNLPSTVITVFIIPEAPSLDFPSFSTTACVCLSSFFGTELYRAYEDKNKKRGQIY